MSCIYAKICNRNNLNFQYVIFLTHLKCEKLTHNVHKSYFKMQHIDWKMHTNHKKKTMPVFPTSFPSFPASRAETDRIFRAISTRAPFTSHATEKRAFFREFPENQNSEKHPDDLDDSRLTFCRQNCWNRSLPAPDIEFSSGSSSADGKNRQMFAG